MHANRLLDAHVKFEQQSPKANIPYVPRLKKMLRPASPCSLLLLLLLLLYPGHAATTGSQPQRRAQQDVKWQYADEREQRFGQAFGEGGAAGSQQPAVHAIALKRHWDRE